MAALHKEFCGLAGPTDVLTFRHGEIVISAETAVRQARMFHSNLACEIQLYLLHGLLHLAGFDDAGAQPAQADASIAKEIIGNHPSHPTYSPSHLPAWLARL